MLLDKFVEQFEAKRYSRAYINRVSIESMVHFGNMKLARIHLLKTFEMTRKEMETLIEMFRDKKIELDNQYSEVLDAESMVAFGRKWNPSDYKISAIGCSEFSEEGKNILRSTRHNYHVYHSAIILLNYVLRYHKGN